MLSKGRKGLTRRTINANFLLIMWPPDLVWVLSLVMAPIRHCWSSKKGWAHMIVSAQPKYTDCWNLDLVWVLSWFCPHQWGNQIKNWMHDMVLSVSPKGIHHQLRLRDQWGNQIKNWMHDMVLSVSRKGIHHQLRLRDDLPLENSGIEPETSCMLSTRSANWANPPL